LKKIKHVSIQISDLQRKSTVFETLKLLARDSTSNISLQRQIGPETSVMEEIKKSKTASEEALI
jgi:hypothetical protein